METFKLSVSGTALEWLFLGLALYKLTRTRETRGGILEKSDSNSRAQEMKCYDFASVRLRDALASPL